MERRCFWQPVHGIVPSLFHATGGTDLQNSDKLALVKHLRANLRAETLPH